MKHLIVLRLKFRSTCPSFASVLLVAPVFLDMYTFKVNRGDEGGILFLTYELLKFITEREASFFIAKSFLTWVLTKLDFNKMLIVIEIYFYMIAVTLEAALTGEGAKEYLSYYYSYYYSSILLLNVSFLYACSDARGGADGRRRQGVPLPLSVAAPGQGAH